MKSPNDLLDLSLLLVPVFINRNLKIAEVVTTSHSQANPSMLNR